MKQKSKLIRSDLEFEKFLEEVKIERIKRNRDRKLLSDRRLTLALTRVPRLKDLLVDANIMEDIK